LSQCWEAVLRGFGTVVFIVDTLRTCWSGEVLVDSLAAVSCCFVGQGWCCDIFEIECVNQRLEPVGHRLCRVRVDDENRAHLAVSSADCDCTRPLTLVTLGGYNNPARRKSTCGVRCGDGYLAETYVTTSHVVVYTQSTALCLAHCLLMQRACKDKLILYYRGYREELNAEHPPSIRVSSYEPIVWTPAIVRMSPIGWPFQRRRRQHRAGRELKYRN
jgi:hypothetical protein